MICKKKSTNFRKHVYPSGEFSLLGDLKENLMLYEEVRIIATVGLDIAMDLSAIIRLLRDLLKVLKFKDKKVMLFIPYIPYGRLNREYFELLKDLTAYGATLRTICMHEYPVYLNTLLKGFLHDHPPIFEFGGFFKDMVCVFPDIGASCRKSPLARECKKIVNCNKKRHKECSSIPTSIDGSVAGEDCVIIDDILDSGCTIATTATYLKQLGAKKVYAVVTHCLPTIDRCVICKDIEKIFVGDTINLKEDTRLKKEIALVCPLEIKAITLDYLY